MEPRPPTSTLFPYTTLFRSLHALSAASRAAFTRHQRHDVLGENHARRRQGERVEDRSEEHTSELQSRENLVCRLLLEKKNKEARDTARTAKTAKTSNATSNE